MKFCFSTTGILIRNSFHYRHLLFIFQWQWHTFLKSLRFLFLGENFNKNNFQITNTSIFLLDLNFLMKILILRFLLNNKNVVSKYNLSFYTLFSQNKQSAEDVIVLSAYQVIPSDIFPMSNLRTLFSFRPHVTKAATMLTLCNWDQLKMSKRKSIKKEPTRKHSIYFFSDILFNWDNIEHNHGYFDDNLIWKQFCLVNTYVY